MNARKLILAVALLTPLLGCELAKMALPDSFEKTARPFPVSGRSGFTWSERLAAGDYLMDDVHRGWRTTSSFLASTTFKDSWEYVLKRGGQTLFSVQCATGVEKTAFGRLFGVVGLSTEEASLTASLVPPNGGPGWKLGLWQTKKMFEVPVFSGVLDSGKVRFDVVASRRMAGSGFDSSDITGYELSRGGALVAAVDVLNDGRVLWAESLSQEERDAVMGAAGALLLYRPPEKK